MAVDGVLPTETEGILSAASTTTQGVLSTETLMAFDGVTWTQCVVTLDGVLGA